MTRHLLDLFDLNAQEARALLDSASQLKREARAGQRPALLAGRTLGLIFEKPSMRTRVSFEAAIAQLGGNALFLRAEDVGLGVRESIEDFARVISQYLDALAVRTHHHRLVEDLARHAQVPIINALSDDAHPCQALADLLTIEEETGPLDGAKLAFVGDGNNVARSLAVASSLLGVEFVLVCPPAYAFPDHFADSYRRTFGRSLNVTQDSSVALDGARAVYTDVWTSMGQENEAEQRRQAFASFQLNAKMMKHAPASAIVLHCLPAHRGEEITADVLDGPQSRVIPQAANRLHLQKALLVRLMGAE